MKLALLLTLAVLAGCGNDPVIRYAPTVGDVPTGAAAEKLKSEVDWPAVQRAMDTFNQVFSSEPGQG